MAVNKLTVSGLMEDWAPLSLAEPWDNCGWQIFLNNDEVSNLLVCLTVTPEIINYCIMQNIHLIVSHHPLAVNGIKTFSHVDYAQSLYIEAIKNNISIYAAHTNLDKADNGINDVLSSLLHLQKTEPLLPEKNNPQLGLGRIGYLEKPIPLDSFIDLLKKQLCLTSFRVINNVQKQTVRKIALCGGSGASLIKHVPYDVDVYMTGDIKYHDALEANHFIIIDANHLDTEQIILEVMKAGWKQLVFQ